MTTREVTVERTVEETENVNVCDYCGKSGGSLVKFEPRGLQVSTPLHYHFEECLDKVALGDTEPVPKESIDAIDKYAPTGGWGFVFDGLDIIGIIMAIFGIGLISAGIAIGSGGAIAVGFVLTAVCGTGAMIFGRGQAKTALRKSKNDRLKELVR